MKAMSKKSKLFIMFGLAVLLFFIMLFLLPLRGYGVENIGLASSVPAQRAFEQTNTAIFVAVAYFSILILQTILFILIKMSLLISNDFSKIIFYFQKTLKRGECSLRGIAEADGIPLSFTKVTLLDVLEHHIGYTTTDRNGRFSFFAPKGNYILEADKFGYEFDAIKPIVLDEKYEKAVGLRGKKTEDAIINPPLISYLQTCQAIWLCLILLGLVTLWFVLPHIGVARASLILVATIASLAIYILNSHTYLFFRDKKGRIMVDSEFEISDHKGTKIVAAKTNRNGIVRMIASPGFYKVTSNKTLTRTFKISAKEIVDLELKV